MLINLHGGGFMVGGGGPGGRVESIPIADVGKIKVISIDYRLAPEHTFPAASEDVAAVYRDLLKHYDPKNIGIYGCSGGGELTGQVMAWFQKEQLPMPGAIGIFCASTDGFAAGDSGQLTARLTGEAGELPPATREAPPKFYGAYFKGVSENDPLAIPSASSEVMAKFPPTLFVTGTRAVEMSSALKSQIQLTLLGVEARMSIWDGMLHGFFYDPDLPESAEAYRVITDFFSEHLGRGPAPKHH